MNDFLLRVANILEVSDVSEDFEFRTAPGWGSMMGFALFIMLEDEYGCKITPDEFRNLKFVSDLMSVVPGLNPEKQNNEGL
ncbi:MAG: acyl carrier protein [Kiritimatiellae bacterium]|nr:acyl carrier protein [Kiritimatiellia bacterium]